MLEKLKEKWDEILLNLKEEHEITDVSFKTWLLPLKVHSINGDTVTVTVPDVEFLGYIRKKYGFLLKITIEEVTGFECNVDFVVENQVPQEEVPKAQTGNTLINNALNTVSQSAIINANLNPKYTFDTFVSGPNNNIALAASLSMAGLNNNLKGKNPLYLYGGVGLGKTHLMQAIGHEIIRKDPSKKVLYVTSETFTNDLIMSLKNNTPETFRQKYRSVDVLMVDDVQFFSGKNSTQEELFHTFNVLQGQNKKIIFTSDKYPKDISGLEDRLTSRFGSGAVFDIQPPEFETRVAILQKKAQDENMSVDMDIIYYIAENVKSNIRELEGALNTVSFYASIAGRKIDLDTAREALKNQIISYNTKETNILRIKETVADAYNVTVEELDSKKRSKNIAFPRQVAMYLARNLLDKSLPKIGEEFGGRDHTTVMHAIKRIEDEIEKDDMTRMRIEKITSDLNG